MAALQQSPVAFQSKSPPSNRITAKTLTPKPIRLSFSGSFTSLKIPKLAGKLSAKTKNRGGAGGATMLDTAASRYATALAEVAKSNGSLEATSADVEKIEKVFSDPDIYNFFVNPTIDMEKKYKVIEEIAKSSNLKPHTLNFLNILVDVKRIDLIRDIVKQFELVYNALTDTELAVVTSVVKLESQHLAQIAKGVQRLTGSKNVRIKTVIDPSLVAGFTIRYGNSGSKLIDMSVKKQLQEIASQLDFSDISLAV
ncbi:ATPase [Macleaya cordata]|uniref:ATPase n=1 Tax=Macleaya cordata TaxID=56857 RepID=A0A200QT99_MACCD|nr:ATPase [Macleaya cordata]